MTNDLEQVLTAKEFLRAVERSPSLRDQALARLLFYTGLRLGECAALNVDDILISARKGLVIVRSGKRYVAIKVLHSKLLEDPNFVTRFELEAQLIASLHHPNIVQIHDFQVSRPPESERTQAYIDGETLARYIGHTSAQGKIPSPAEIVNLFTSISLAIDYAHGKGMVHRDIKPANILLDKNNTTRNPMGEPILTDFGLAYVILRSIAKYPDASFQSASAMTTALADAFNVPTSTKLRPPEVFFSYAHQDRRTQEAGHMRERAKQLSYEE